MDDGDDYPGRAPAPDLSALMRAHELLVLDRRYFLKEIAFEQYRRLEAQALRGPAQPAR